MVGSEKWKKRPKYSSIWQNETAYTTIASKRKWVSVLGRQRHVPVITMATIVGSLNTVLKVMGLLNLSPTAIYLVFCQHERLFTLSATHMIVAAITTSEPWITSRYCIHGFMIIYIGRWCVGYTLVIIPTLYIRTTYAADLGLSNALPSNMISAIPSRHDDGISRWNDAYTLYHSWGDKTWSLDRYYSRLHCRNVHWPSRQMPYM